jgi:polyvinyl alcohol dehydrogenase (cytochrome)
MKKPSRAIKLTQPRTRRSARGFLAALFHMASEAFMFRFPLIKGWQGLALLLLTIQVPAFAEGIDLQNTRSFQGGPINNGTVSQLTVKWVYQTAPDTGTANNAQASISSTPAVDGPYLYFNDLSGYLTKLNRFTGKLIWKKNYVNDLSVPGFVVKGSRNTPHVVGDLIIVGSNMGLVDRLCRLTPGATPSALGCASGDGAIVLAINKKTGQVVWRTKVETHSSSKVTGSISGHGDMIFVPVGNWEEDWARAYPNIYVDPVDPNSPYPCCSARGSLVALDVNTGKMLWKRHTVIGDDPDHELTPALRALLTPKGFFGSSTYGHNPTVDVSRRQVYIATAQTTTAPQVAQDCEIARRKTGDPNANISGLPPGVNCNNLNETLKTYANAMLAIDMDTGRVNWVHYAHKYDAWNHACGAPDLYGWATVVPALFPVPIMNSLHNCGQTPIGPDMGFGQQPKLVRNTSHGDVVVGGNKDGRLFGLDPDTGTKIWETNVDPGGVYGGLQFGSAVDDGKVFFGTTNARNMGRDIRTRYVPVTSFLAINGFTALGLKTGPFVKRDAATPVDYPAPANQNLPFPGPNLVYGITGYPNIYPDPDNIGGPPSFMKGPASGPVEFWTLVNPPSDVSADGVSVVEDSGGLKTIDGMVHAVDAGSGEILWQRPAYDGIKGTVGNGQAFGTLSVGNGVVFIGYQDGKGTMVALDAKSGRKLFEFHNQITLADGSKMRSGSVEGGPQVVGNMVYWGVGAESGGLFTNRDGININAGSRIFGFELMNVSEEGSGDR